MDFLDDLRPSGDPSDVRRDKWASCEGGLPPPGRIPSTRDESPALTLVLLTRYIARSVRFYAGFFYSFDFPGNGTLSGVSRKPLNQFVDILQYRLGLEDIVDDRTGTGYILEFVGMSGFPFQSRACRSTLFPKRPADCMLGLSSFGCFSQRSRPTLPEDLFSGRLVPGCGTNQYQSISPNLSLYGDLGLGVGNVVAGKNFRRGMLPLCPFNSVFFLVRLMTELSFGKRSVRGFLFNPFFFIDF
ncbi:hypothetical protein [Leptospirillum ferriphilum]|uniref:Uncharacterized protein n=1 Tax=Leptospirillum ferriphilum YSK TaxID=1441628 RepID=A0A059XTC0_9BACT|nr:hypothetical protein [Leptospirillum ferriphilum]AIA31854.1 hypothetical protein Y981_09065 [Leptospirillum ferriphilum YSK]OOH75511.1 hypothetical protein BOX30_11630 [Leptospirillum ferriphilum]